MEKINVDGKESHLAFIDLEKTYDMVSRPKLFLALRSLEINQHF